MVSVKDVLPYSTHSGKILIRFQPLLQVFIDTVLNGIDVTFYATLLVNNMLMLLLLDIWLVLNDYCVCGLCSVDLLCHMLLLSPSFYLVVSQRHLLFLLVQLKYLLRWTGHASRMEDHNLPMTVLYDELSTGYRERCPKEMLQSLSYIYIYIYSVFFNCSIDSVTQYSSFH